MNRNYICYYLFAEFLGRNFNTKLKIYVQQRPQGLANVDALKNV